MKYQLCTLLVLVSCKTLYGSYQLFGNLGEYRGIPVSIFCDEEKLKIGGITINNEPVSQKQQNKATEVCDKAMKKKGIKRHGSTCVLTFPGMDLSSTDDIRIIYRCYSSVDGDAPGWSKAGGNNEPKEATIGKNKKTKLHCPNKGGKIAMLFITSVTLGALGEDTAKTHASLHPDVMTKNCFEQMKVAFDTEEDEAKQGSKCTIENDYEDTLSLEYSCLYQGDKRKNVNNGKKNLKLN